MTSNENDSNNESSTLQEFVRRGIQTGLSREDTFERAVQKFHNCYLGKKTTSQWFEKLDEDLHSYLPERHRPLLQLIFCAYQQAERGIQAQSCPSARNCNLRMLNSRYAVGIWEVTLKFYGLVVFDLFHGVKRELRIKDLILTTGFRTKLEVIDPTHLLLIRSSMEAPDYQHLIHIHLIELSLFEAESRVLDTRVLEGCYFSFIQDEKDRSAFLLNVIHGEQTGFWAGRLVNSALEFGSQLLDASAIFNHYKLKFEGNQLYGFCCREANNQECIYYESTLLNSGPSDTVRLFQMEHDEDFRFFDLLRAKYFWFKHACFVLQWFENTGTNVFKLDLESRRIARIVQYNRILPVKDFWVDGDEMLSVCTESEYRKQHILYRFPLRQPDKLLILALMATRRQQLIFLSRDKYDQAMSKFPPTLHPFVNSL